MLLPAALVLLVRRWWATAAIAGLGTGILLATMHVGAIPTYDEGDSQDLTVVLTSAAQVQHGQWGDSWRATGKVVAGGARATVGIGGQGGADHSMGDTVSARMRITAANRPGQAATVWVQGEPEVTIATGPSASVRRTLRAAAGPSDAGWLLSGMTLGMDQGLSEQARADMRDAGLTHLTAVSGSNCAVLLLVVQWMCGWSGLGRVSRVVVGGIVLLAFILTVGAEPSILRAGFMAGLAMAAGLVGGRRAAAHVLQMSVVLLLLIDPWLAYSVGFMLSIAATAGLIALIDRGPLAATVAAQVATLPILLAIGASVGLRSILANVLVTPLAAVVPLLGLTAIGTAPLHVGLPAALGRQLSSLVLVVAGWDVAGPLPWLPGWAGVALAAMVSLVVLARGRRRTVMVAAVMLGGISLITRVTDGWPPRDWWLVACDVGQGDGFVVRSADRVLVVDTGPDPKLMDQCLQRLNVRSVDLLVITHFHADHVAGLPGVVDGRSIGQVWVSPCEEPPETYDEAAPLLRGLPVSIPTAGSVAQLGDMQLRVVWPRRIIQAGSVSNNASVSFLLTGPQGSVAFLGDIEEEAQQAILDSGEPLKADIVKVPHHGSAGFDPDLPTAVQPQLALIGVGVENTFGHPTPEAVAAWQQVGARVFTTEDNGDIAVTRGRQVVVRGLSRPPVR